MVWKQHKLNGHVLFKKRNIFGFHVWNNAFVLIYFSDPTQAPFTTTNPGSGSASYTTQQVSKKL